MRDDQRDARRQGRVTAVGNRNEPGEAQGSGFGSFSRRVLCNGRPWHGGCGGSGGSGGLAVASGGIRQGAVSMPGVAGFRDYAQHDIGVLPHDVMALPHDVAALPREVVASPHNPLVPHGAYPDR